MLFPDALELSSSILRDLSLDVFNIALVEFRRAVIFEDHEIDILLSRQRKTGKDFER